MALILTEDQKLLADSARAFFKERSPVSALRSLRDSGQEWSAQLWKEMADMGWAGIAIPEAYGGLDFGYVGPGLLMEEGGRTLASSPLLSSALVCSSLIVALGNERQKQELLPAMASGELILGLALDEGNRLNPAACAMTSVADGGSYVLTGRKLHVLDGNIAHKFLVVARTAGASGDKEGLSLFLVDARAEGLHCSTTLNADSRVTASLSFESVRVESSHRIGDAGSAWGSLEKALDIGAACSAAELLGLSQEAFERTVEYLKTRKQFGVLIGSFQALQHRAAQMFCELSLCRSAVLRALQALDENGADRSQIVSMAKAKAAKTAQLVVNEAVQMHGGIGMTDEFEIGFFMKRAACARQEYGDYYFHANQFAELRGY